MTIRVKPLQWDNSYQHNIYEAVTPFGTFTASDRRGYGMGYATSFGGMGSVYKAEEVNMKHLQSLEEGMAIVDKYYEKLILSLVEEV